jgi:hypothetical protein
MTALDLLKAELHDNQIVIPRTLAPVEILDLEEGVLNSDKRLETIINFPLPLTGWNSEAREVSHVVKAWGWERDGHLFMLVELPGEIQGPMLESLIPLFNSKTDIHGRFYLAAAGKTYYINSQAIFCKEDTGDGGPISLHRLKATREAAKHLTTYTLAGTVKDLSWAVCPETIKSLQKCALTG